MYRVALPHEVAEVTSVVASPDGELVAVGGAARGQPGGVRVWDVARGSPVRHLKTPEPGITSMAWSPDGSTLATAHLNRTVRLWDPRTGEALGVLDDPEGLAVVTVTFTPDGRTLVTGTRYARPTPSRVRLWDLARRQPRAECAGHLSSVYAVACSPDGALVASCGSDLTVRLWDAATGAPRGVLVGHTGTVQAVAFAPDSRTLASAGDDGKVRLWDVEAGKTRLVLEAFRGPVLAVAFSPDGRTLATGSRKLRIWGELKLWDPVTGQERGSLEGHLSGVRSLAFARGGRTLVSGGDPSVRLWDAEP
jgi:WD40 repeat protein